MAGGTHTILVVDDDRDILETLSANIELEGYAVVEALDGAQAVTLVADRPDVDLVLSDIRMPRMDGVEALARIKALRPDLPVILMTAYAVQDLEDRAFLGGVYTIVRKPFDMGRVLTVIARALPGPAILVIDGRDDARDQVMASLRSCGHRAVAVADPRAAAAALRDRAVDVAVLEADADGDALAALRDLRALAAALPVVLLSRDASREVREEAAALGVAAWVETPVAAAQLIRLIAEVRAKAN